MRNSLQRRLTWRLLLCFLLLWGFLGATWYGIVRQAWRAEWDAELTWLAREACYLLPEGSGLPPLAPSAEALEFSDPASGLYFEIWDADLLFSDRSLSLGERSLPVPASFRPDPLVEQVLLSNGEPLRVLFQQLIIPRSGYTTDALFNVAVARNRTVLDQRLKQLLMTIGASILAVMILTVLFILFSIRKAFRPLRRLENQIENMDANSLEQRLDPADVPEEVLPMVKRLNGLLQRLEQSFRRESRFTSDVAHELRTPVAELCALAEFQTLWPERASPGDPEDFLRIGHHMKRQIEALLALARLDQGQGGETRERVDLVDLIAIHWDSLADQADARGLQVELPDIPAASAIGDPDLLSIIVRNLLENAVAYTPADGTVRVTVRQLASDPLLRVENQVQAPEILDTTAMFDRFWRAEGARTGDGHSGLGLALCRSGAAAMGLDLRAALDPASALLSVCLVEADTSGE